MNKDFFERIVKSKANALVCLFLLCPVFGSGQTLTFESSESRAHELALDLRCTDALKALSGRQSAASAYVTSLAEAIELLVTEDADKFIIYEERFQDRLERDYGGSEPDKRFLQAEFRLHWAFVYLKFGHELDAALSLRQAFQIAARCREEFPRYLPIRKTSGLLSIMVGSVPDKYNWILSLLSLRGSVPEGLADLRTISNSDSPLALEGKILLGLVQGFILSEPDDGLAQMQTILDEDEGNRLTLFFASSLALKTAENELAIELLDKLTTDSSGTPLYYAHYLMGEAMLHKGDYRKAVSSYRWFLDHQPGENYIKDAWYKTGLCYWLGGHDVEAQRAFETARRRGKESTEADKSAARTLVEPHLPDTRLAKARYFTDGGYYDEAGQILSEIEPGSLEVKKDQAEYYYRRARLAHKTGSPEAVDLYLRTIETSGQESWYFAPNACLQLGYLFREKNRPDEAAAFFRRALSYRRHEYKNSIDSKARSALAQLRRM